MTHAKRLAVTFLVGCLATAALLGLLTVIQTGSALLLGFLTVIAGGVWMMLTFGLDE